MIRATVKEKKYQISTINQLHKTYQKESKKALDQVKDAALNNKNVFNYLMEASKYCSIGQITDALFEVGGQYRSNM